MRNISESVGGNGSLTAIDTGRITSVHCANVPLSTSFSGPAMFDAPLSPIAILTQQLYVLCKRLFFCQ